MFPKDILLYICSYLDENNTHKIGYMVNKQNKKNFYIIPKCSVTFDIPIKIFFSFSLYNKIYKSVITLEYDEQFNCELYKSILQNVVYNTIEDNYIYMNRAHGKELLLNNISDDITNLIVKTTYNYGLVHKIYGKTERDSGMYGELRTICNTVPNIIIPKYCKNLKILQTFYGIKIVNSQSNLNNLVLSNVGILCDVICDTLEINNTIDNGGNIYCNKVFGTISKNDNINIHVNDKIKLSLENNYFDLSFNKRHKIFLYRGSIKIT